MKIFYGLEGFYKDITQIVFQTCFIQQNIYIPSDDNFRGFIFGDPAFGKVKHICVKYDDVRKDLIFTDKQVVNLFVPNEDIPSEIHSIKISIPKEMEGSDANEKIKYLHSKLIFVDGSLIHEYNEQMMAIQYLNPKAKVLELGSNIGRNTVIIASILEDDRNLVTLECDPVSVHSLRKNRFLNKFRFSIEPSALSYKKLIQKGWDTIPSDIVLEGYKSVKTVTFQELEEKYKIPFDTLIADCEGALYYILQDYKEMMQNIKMVILESDFQQESHKQFVESVFQEYGLKKIFSEPLTGHPDYIMNKFPKVCRDSFFEVWKRD